MSEFFDEIMASIDETREAARNKKLKVSYGNPVYLTKNGRDDCALIDIRELDELRAIKGLFSELEKGEASVRKDGWISLEEAEKRLGV